MFPPRPQPEDKAEASSASALSSRDRGCPPHGLHLPQLPMTVFLSSPVPGHRQQGIIKSLLTLPTSRAQRAGCAQTPPLRLGLLGRGLAHECRQEPVQFYS